MPFYEYQCDACAHRLEVLQKISDEPLKYCPECGEASLKKLISKAGFRLKGGGWYETDFKHGGKSGNKSNDKSGDKSDSGNASESASSSSGGKSSDNASPKKSSTAEAMPADA